MKENYFKEIVSGLLAKFLLCSKENGCFANILDIDEISDDIEKNLDILENVNFIVYILKIYFKKNKCVSSIYIEKIEKQIEETEKILDETIINITKNKNKEKVINAINELERILIKYYIDNLILKK